jgi:hypothetical protein
MSALRRFHDGPHDPVVSTASTQVPVQALANVVFAHGVPSGAGLIHSGSTSHHDSGKAVAALPGLVLNEGLLHRVGSLLGQSLDGGDVLAVDGPERGVARVCRYSVHPDRACSAGTRATAEPGSGQTPGIAQRPQECSGAIERCSPFTTTVKVCDTPTP